MLESTAQAAVHVRRRTRSARPSKSWTAPSKASVRIIGRLSPLVLKELGLVAGHPQRKPRISAKNTGSRARVMVAEDLNRLDPEVEMVIYRVVQRRCTMWPNIQMQERPTLF